MRMNEAFCESKLIDSAHLGFVHSSVIELGY